jgi:hypothetical protein
MFVISDSQTYRSIIGMLAAGTETETIKIELILPPLLNRSFKWSL